jgi:hypothetical protein
MEEKERNRVNGVQAGLSYRAFARLGITFRDGEMDAHPNLGIVK